MLGVLPLRRPPPGWLRFQATIGSDPFCVSNCRFRIADCEEKQQNENRKHKTSAEDSGLYSALMEGCCSVRCLNASAGESPNRATFDLDTPQSYFSEMINVTENAVR